MVLKAAQIMNVGGGTDPLDLAGISLGQRRSPGLVPAVLAVGYATDTVLDVVVAAGLSLTPGRDGQITVIGMHCVQPAEIAATLVGQSGENRPLRAAPGALAGAAR